MCGFNTYKMSMPVGDKRYEMMLHRPGNTASRVLLAFILLISTAGLLGGCGGGGGGNSTGTEPSVYSPNYVGALEHLLHWQTLPVKVFFSVPGNWTTYYPAGLTTTAAESWNQPNWQAFFVVVGRADQANVVCTFVDTPPNEWSANQVGETAYTYDPRTSIISSKPGDVKVTITIHNGYGNPLTPAEMQGVIAHELGHVLGISGHSPYTEDLLYEIEQAGIITPQLRDLNTVRTAYQAYFGTRSAKPIPTQPVTPSDLVHRTIR